MTSSLRHIEQMVLIACAWRDRNMPIRDHTAPSFFDLYSNPSWAMPSLGYMSSSRLHLDLNRRMPLLDPIASSVFDSLIRAERSRDRPSLANVPGRCRGFLACMYAFIDKCTISFG